MCHLYLIQNNNCPLLQFCTLVVFGSKYNITRNIHLFACHSQHKGALESRLVEPCQEYMKSCPSTSVHTMTTGYMYITCMHYERLKYENFLIEDYNVDWIQNFGCSRILDTNLTSCSWSSPFHNSIGHQKMGRPVDCLYFQWKYRQSTGLPIFWWPTCLHHSTTTTHSLTILDVWSIVRATHWADSPN